MLKLKRVFSLWCWCWCCSHECTEHEQKARERKEALEAQVKDHETVLSQLSGTVVMHRDMGQSNFTIGRHCLDVKFAICTAQRKEKAKAQKKDYKYVNS